MFGGPIATTPSSSHKLLLDSQSGNGLEVRVSYEERAMVLHLSNKSGKSVSNCQLKFNKNEYGINGALRAPLSAPIPPGGSGSITVNLGFQQPQLDPSKVNG